MIRPLVNLEHTGYSGADGSPPNVEPTYKAVCRECGDITRLESRDMAIEAPMAQADLYARRHLDRHLTALTAEIASRNR